MSKIFYEKLEVPVKGQALFEVERMPEADSFKLSIGERTDNSHMEKHSIRLDRIDLIHLVNMLQRAIKTPVILLQEDAA